MSIKKKSVLIIAATMAVTVISFTVAKMQIQKNYNKKYSFITNYLNREYGFDAEIKDVRIDNIIEDDKEKIKYTFKLKEECYDGLYAVFIQDEEINNYNLNMTELDYKKYNKINDFGPDHSSEVPEKPVIYLYPEEDTDINVRLYLDENTRLTYTYPEYNEETGWNVTATPDSVLTDENGYEYSYLFWEGVTSQDWDMSYGFVVKGEDTVEFFREKLSCLGLTPKEYNDFIVYWMPRMQDNKYNLITFRTDEYTDMARLEVTPEPESVQRVFMTFKALDEYQEIEEQVLEPFERHGYTLIEWGGLEIK